jgi:hypothetical protein
MTKASLDLEFAHHYRRLNCFAKPLTSTGHLELIRTQVQQAAGLELLLPGLQVCSVEFT